MLKWTSILLFLCFTGAYQKATIHNCLWHKNSCVDVCPEGLVEIKSDCKQTYWEAQRTCQFPEQMLVATLCGFSRCDCPSPTVLDTDTGYCYDVDNCPTKHEINFRPLPSHS